MAIFSDFIEDMELMDLAYQGQFTWRKGDGHTTAAKLDNFFSQRNGIQNSETSSSVCSTENCF